MWGLRDRAILFAERGVIGSQHPVGFCWILFLLGLLFTQQQQKVHSLFAAEIVNRPPTPKPTMISLVVIIAQEVMENNLTKTKIWVGSVVKSNVVSME